MSELRRKAEGRIWTALVILTYTRRTAWAVCLSKSERGRHSRGTAVCCIRACGSPCRDEGRGCIRHRQPVLARRKYLLCPCACTLPAAPVSALQARQSTHCHFQLLDVQHVTSAQLVLAGGNAIVIPRGADVHSLATPTDFKKHARCTCTCACSRSTHLQHGSVRISADHLLPDCCFSSYGCCLGGWH